MSFDGGAIVRSNFNIHTDDPSFSHGLAQTGVEDKRAAVGNTGFDNDIRLQAVDHFLNTNNVFRKLDDGPPEPRECIGIFLVPTYIHPLLGESLERLRTVQRQRSTAAAILQRQCLGIRIQRKFHAMLTSLARSASSAVVEFADSPLSFSDHQ